MPDGEEGIGGGGGGGGEPCARLEGSDVVFQTRIMNQHLICSLCMGYLRDAMTITECLHKFCKACINKHFQGNSSCPTCEVNLGPSPVEKIRQDRAIQNIVDKVFPHFVREEAVAEKHYKGEGETGKARSAESNAQSEAKRKRVEKNVAVKRQKSAKEATPTGPKICLSLFPQEEGLSPDEIAPKLNQPYLRSSVDATLKQCKLYLSRKVEEEHGIKASKNDIELKVNGVVLKDEYTFGYVWKEMWKVDEDLALEYKIVKREKDK